MILLAILAVSVIGPTPVAVALKMLVPPTEMLLTLVGLDTGKAVADVAAFPLARVTTGVNPLEPAGPSSVMVLPEVVAL